MTTHDNSTPSWKVDWASLIPTLSPFAVYGVIMTLVAIFAEG